MNSPLPPSQCLVLEAEAETTESWKLALPRTEKPQVQAASCKSALFMSEVGIGESGSLKHKGLFFFFSGEQEHQARKSFFPLFPWVLAIVLTL